MRALGQCLQLRHATELTGEQYVTQQGWRLASLGACPLHPEGGCGFTSHGTYPRAEPPGMRVRRYYCPKDGVTFSLLPDCLCARLSGSLDETEQVVLAVERARSFEAACATLRPEIGLPGVLRWVRRRFKAVRAALLVLVTALPGKLGSEATLVSVRATLCSERALVLLRGIAADRLGALASPVGFCPAQRPRRQSGATRQHKTGTDPPVPLA